MKEFLNLLRGARTWALVVGIAVLGGLTLVACGSSSSSSDTGNSGGESTTAAGEEGSGGEESDSSAVVAAATEELEKALIGPTEWEGPTEAVKPPKDFKVAILACDMKSYGCRAPAEGSQHAAEALGWESKIFNGESDPNVYAKRIEEAIAEGADGIITESVDGRSVADALAHAKQAGIPVISTSNAAAPGEQNYEVDISPNFLQFGKDIAAWVISDSNGEGVLAIYRDPEFQSTVSAVEGILEGMEPCTTCTVNEPINFVAADVAERLAPETVAMLRANPDVDYIHLSYDPAAALTVPAILEAGLGEGLQGSSTIGDELNLGFIREGKVQAADAVWSNEYQGYASIDQLIRLATGKEPWVSDNQPERFQLNENLPSVLITKENVPPEGEIYEPPFDYKSEYEKIWGLK